MSNFYSRSGDDGTTGLLGNERLPKDDPRIEAVGSIDEANAVLGIIRSQIKNNDIKENAVINMLSCDTQISGFAFDKNYILS